MTANQQCTSCQSHVHVESVTVRIYRKRWQSEYRYRLCGDCTRLLDALLSTNAIATQRSLFDHRMGTSRPAEG